MYIIPLTTSPNQTFTSTIPIGGKKIRLLFFLRYNTEQKCWEMDISNSDKKQLV
ncbi:phage baseplate plug family protein, partial [Clostridium botulinum]|uniref:phage baseplate plug family protein n=1 Tax=Clostridium botulinum TaxID=1491 RepID=UPI000AF2F4C1